MQNDSKTRPDFSPDQALRIAESHFGVSATKAGSLPSDRDQNFVLTDEETGRKFVLKLSQTEENPQVLDLQNRMLEHLARAGFPLSKLLFAKDGKEVVAVTGEDGSVFLTRLLTWVPGVQLRQVNPQRPALLQSLGAFLGGMGRALEDFSHPAQDRELKWDLKRADAVIRGHLEYVPDPGRRDLLERMARRFLERLRPLVSELRLSVIHSDANDHNVLVNELAPGADPGARKVSGLVDFGDAVRSYTAGEVAIAGCYAMLGRGNPLTAASHIVNGFHRALPLREAEIAALFPLMGLRLCTSVAISAQQKRREPEDEYLTVSEAPAWDLLKRLDGEILDLPHLLFREACGLDPVPSSGRIVAWMEAHGGEASPVIGKEPGPPFDHDAGRPAPLDLTRTPVHVFDLSGDSVELPQPPDPKDVERWTDLLFRTMKTAKAEVGVGRYDEVRTWYTADIFRAPGHDPPEWRTVHLGIDLFVEAGSQVLAPFDAVVHSVANNTGTLDYGPTVILEHQAAVEMGGGLRFWTLYGHLAEEVTSQLYPGQPVPRGEAFARIGSPPVNGNWAPHLHFQVITDRLGMEGTFPGVALPSQRKLWKSLSPDPNLILRVPDRAKSLGLKKTGTRIPFPGPAEAGRPSGAPLSGAGGHSRERLLEARRKHLGPSLSIAYKDPLKIVRGSGQFLFDDEGQTYLDCVNNVPHVGHSHPRVVEAGQKQMALLNTNTRYLHDLLVDYAERLLATLPKPLSVVYFTCTGSEANELALRMARAHAKRKDVLVVDGAYHGNTSAMVDLSPYKFDRPGGEGPRSWVHKTLMPDPYRGRFRELDEEGPGQGASPGGEPENPTEYLPADELGLRYAGHVQEILAGMRAKGREPAAFFCESLLGCGGQIVLPDGYMAKTFEHVREAGGVCVADEVQVGFGRVGTHFWGFETQGVVPDILTLGKPMANGHPMAAVVTTREIAKSFTTGMEYFNTFGGNPVSCAIALAVLDVIEEEGLQENARRVGEHLLAGLRELKGRHRLIGDVRGLGLFIGVELVEDRGRREPAPGKACQVKERLREQRLLLSTDGPDDNVLKIKPPLVFTTTDADRLISTLDRVLEEDSFRS
ncbi:MAG: aminotransferase class III-fold pyridoxal phosphate-dependent enzyme [Gemmatimonadota bacterium]